MKIPARQKAAPEVTVRFTCDGGLNLCDDKTCLAANQASDMLNMWYDGRALTLRPGLLTLLTHAYGRILDYYPRSGGPLLLKRIARNGTVTDESYGIYIVTEKAILTFDGTSLTRVADSIAYQNGGWVKSYADYSLGPCTLLPASNVEYDAQGADSAEWSVRGSIFYLIGSGKFLLIGPYLVDDMITLKTTADITVSFIEPYVPMIFSGCAPAGGGSADEARNYLTPQVCQQFTTDGTATLYRLADSTLDDAQVTVQYDSVTRGTLTFSFFSGETADTVSGITATLSRSAGTVSFSAALVDAASYKLKNNLSASYSKTLHPASPISGCTLGAWLGSLRGDGGSRLFLSGNPSEPGEVYYSAAGNAAYFPDDCRIALGDPSDPVTAFGWFYDALIAFKQSSIYSIGYLSGGSAAAASLAHAGRGCDMPGSVRLVDNLLLFANTTGGVYALCHTQVRDERDVVSISRNIAPALSALGKDALSRASALNFGGYYMLFAGDRVFLWDYARTPLTGAKETDALAWYIWRLPQTISGSILFQCELLAYDDSGNIFKFDAQSAVDSGGWFDAWFYTGLNDFGKPLLTK
ncbi:MAG: hypothetical protein P4L75_04660, partial [Clostridia bacterium]|nr:hypothetical protein [Clostridia bacterium]